MRTGPRVALLLALLLLAATVPLVADAGGAAGTGDERATLARQEAPPIAPDSSNLTVNLRADGSARWTVESAFTLGDADDRRAFERLVREFRNGEAAAGFDVQTFERASAAASRETGRPMQITRIQRSVGRDRGPNVTVGYLRTSFTWTNFSRANESWLVADDVFNTSNGTWFPGLAADQRLIVSPPPGYSTYDAPIRPQQGRYVWEGPATFRPGSLSMTFEYTGRNGGTPDGDGPLDPATLGILAATVLGVGALILGGYAWMQNGRPDGWPASGGAGGGDGTETADGAANEAAAGAGAAAGAAEAEDDATGADDEAESAVDVELLSDEERVEYLLRQNGGRMKQANIVKETGWSNAKVSQLLSSMDDDDRVDKLRIGRENLISLPDEDVGEIDDS